MMCPVCKTRQNKVLDTRANPEFILRKRQCNNGHKYQTKEYAIFETPICEESETPKASGGSLLSKLWHGQWNSGGTR
jgi:transcriptional regulator NrdR family protein